MNRNMTQVKMQHLSVVINLSALFQLVGSVTKFHIGFTIVGEAGSPFDKHRVDPAVDIAFDHVNREILNSSYEIVKLERNYGQFCSGTRAAGKQTIVYYPLIKILYGPKRGLNVLHE